MIRCPGFARLAAAVALAGCSGDQAMSGAAAAAPLDFTEARVVSQETENGSAPMLFTRGNGDRIAAWVSAEEGGSDGRLQLAITRAGAVQSEPVVTLVDPLGSIEPHGEAPPKVAENESGTLFILYAVSKKVPGLRFPVSSLRFVRSHDGGSTWSEPVTVNAGERFAAHNFHALNAGGGLVVATWLKNGPGGARVAMARSFDEGSTFEPERSLAFGEACPCCRTAIAISSGGEMYLAWRGVEEGDVRDIFVSRSDDDGETWGDPVKPREDGWVFPACPHAGPDMEVDQAGRVHIAWWTGKEGEAGVFHARSADGGATWAATPIAVGERSLPAHVQLAVAGDDVLVAWDDGLSRLPGVMVRWSSDGGTTFGGRQQLSAEGEAARFPVLTRSGDTISVAWSQRGAAEHVQAEANKPDHANPDDDIPLPKVGGAHILMRSASLQ